MEEKNLVFTDEILRDYYHLNESVAENLLRHTSSIAFRERNFIIENKKNLEIIFELLKYESSKNNCKALNTLGFLYYHGIDVK
jgi:hypothetical protein